jgi:tetratricopeptide (TPR) repeat protein
LPEQRLIRVFVSSTFIDMQPEREELIKRVFPQLRKLCESRGATWSEVDLRWGVTDEQQKEGQVLPICLAEVRRCRPYFIGLLGNRYGSTLDQVDARLLEREPWIADYRGRSLTELEIICGVLRNPEMAEHAFFYFRDPSASAAPPLAPETHPDSAEKLAALKDQIRKSGFPVRENYRSAQALGEFVLADFTRLIDRLFPEAAPPNPLDREAALHEAFAESRTSIYIGHRELLDRLHVHARGDGPPLVVLGESGLGKSALLANWAARYRAAQADNFVFVHFVGASAASTDWAALVRRFLGECNRRCRLSIPIADKPDALRQAFADGLRMVASMHRVVIVLDALNHLDDQDQAPDLAWLPRDLLPRVRLIVSTLPGRALDEIERRGWQTLALAPLSDGERRQLIVEYLARYTKALTRRQLDEIAAVPLCANPLFLTALLEELRVWGDHETLQARIPGYLSVSSIGELFAAILERYEADYERDRPNLVRDAMTAIWAARHGLSEAELFDLLGEAGEPRRAWSALSLAAERSLVNHVGLIGFFHDYFRQAAQDRYLPTEVEQRAAHARLADYFSSRELSPRKVAELPWQLEKAQQWERLRDLLADLSFVSAAWAEHGHDVRGYWNRVIERIPDAVLKAYQPAFDDPNNEKYQSHLYLLACLLYRLDHYKESLKLINSLIDWLDRMADAVKSITPDPHAFVQLLVDAAANYLRQDDFQNALIMCQSGKDIARATRNQWCMAASVGFEATVLTKRGDLAEAETLWKQAEELWRTLGDKKALAQVMSGYAGTVVRHDPARGLRLLAEQERLLRDLGDQDSLSACLGNQGTALKELGQLEHALQKHVEQEDLCRQIGDASGLQLALFQKADDLQRLGKYRDSLPPLQEAEAIAQKLGKTGDVAGYLLFQAEAHEAEGQLIKAIQLCKRAESLYREVGNIDRMVRMIFNQARLYAEHVRKPPTAVPGMRQAQHIAEASGLNELALELKRTADKYQAWPG